MERSIRHPHRWNSKCTKITHQLLHSHMTEALSTQRTGPSWRHSQRESRKGRSSSTAHTHNTINPTAQHPLLTHRNRRLTSAEGVATNLANFGTVRWAAYLRPPATKEGKRERNVVAVMARTKMRCRRLIPIRMTTVSGQGKMFKIGRSTKPGGPRCDERSCKRPPFALKRN